jgi:acetolactate synthase-1/2/3 large subunit
MKTGGKLIVEALEANGTDRIFCVPGESYLAVLDALHDSPIRTIVCRQEGGAAMMADCQGRLTGKPGVCFVTRGPGATNASAGIHIAMQDSVPLILFIGQVASHAKEREAFQEVDYKRFFGDIAKWVVEIDDASRIPEFVTRAFAVATSGRPGPVVISLPEDMLTSEVEAPSALAHTPVETRPGAAELDALEKLLGGASRPFVILGAGMGKRWRGCRRSPRHGRCPSAVPSAARCCSTTCTPTTPAMSASASIRSWGRRSSRPTWFYCSAAAWARCHRPTTRC